MSETWLERWDRVTKGRNYTAALAMLREPQGPGVSEWLTIESAPKDGTAILAAWRTGPTGEGPYAVDKLWWAGSWCEYNRKPTHWMPLPPPPSNNPKGEG